MSAAVSVATSVYERQHFPPLSRCPALSSRKTTEENIPANGAFRSHREDFSTLTSNCLVTWAGGFHTRFFQRTENVEKGARNFSQTVLHGLQWPANSRVRIWKLCHTFANKNVLADVDTEYYRNLGNSLI